MTLWQVQVTSETTVVQFAVTADSYEDAEPLIDQRLAGMNLPTDIQLFIAPQNRHEHWIVDDSGADLHQGLRDECEDERCRAESR